MDHLKEYYKEKYKKDIGSTGLCHVLPGGMIQEFTQEEKKIKVWPVMLLLCIKKVRQETGKVLYLTITIRYNILYRITN